MKYTNSYNLSEEIVKAITEDDYDYYPNQISTTRLILPTKIFVLKERHEKDIVEDVSEGIWRLFGTAVHTLLAKQKYENKAIEERLRGILKQHVITGKPDMFCLKEGHLKDFKVTSVWSYIFGKDGKEEWEQQLNIYAWLLRKNGMEVNKLTIVAILRDWNYRESTKNVDYPQIAIQEISIPLWTRDRQEEFISERLSAIEAGRNLEDDDIPECSSKERWASPTTWAIMKPGRKNALRVFKTEEEAINYEKPSDCWIEERRGEDRRCKQYCNVNKWCHYWKGVNEDG